MHTQFFRKGATNIYVYMYICVYVYTGVETQTQTQTQTQTHTHTPFFRKGAFPVSFIHRVACFILDCFGSYRLDFASTIGKISTKPP